MKRKDLFQLLCLHSSSYQFSVQSCCWLTFSWLTMLQNTFINVVIYNVVHHLCHNQRWNGWLYPMDHFKHFFLLHWYLSFQSHSNLLELKMLFCPFSLTMFGAFCFCLVMVFCTFKFQSYDDDAVASIAFFFTIASIIVFIFEIIHLVSAHNLLKIFHDHLFHCHILWYYFVSRNRCVQNSFSVFDLCCVQFLGEVDSFFLMIVALKWGIDWMELRWIVWGIVMNEMVMNCLKWIKMKWIDMN